MTYTLLHHTGCGTSRKGLALLEAEGIPVNLRKYMNKAEQMTETELRDLAKKLGAASPRDFWREKDALAAGLSATASDDEIYAAMAADPKLIQRPIGIRGKKAVLGRPIEQLLNIR